MEIPFRTRLGAILIATMEQANPIIDTMNSPNMNPNHTVIVPTIIARTDAPGNCPPEDSLFCMLFCKLSNEF